MARIYVVDTGVRSTEDPSSVGQIAISVGVQLSFEDGSVFKQGADIMVTMPSNAATWKTTFRDAVVAWATANGHTVVRLVHADFTVTTP